MIDIGGGKYLGMGLRSKGQLINVGAQRGIIVGNQSCNDYAECAYTCCDRLSKFFELYIQDNKSVELINLARASAFALDEERSE